MLEDDVWPEPSFFPFMQELLARYRDDSRVGSISSHHFHRQPSGGSSYRYSIYNHCWGWGSWRRAWQQYDMALSSWPAFRDEGLLAEARLMDPRRGVRQRVLIFLAFLVAGLTALFYLHGETGQEDQRLTAQTVYGFNGLLLSVGLASVWRAMRLRSEDRPVALKSSLALEGMLVGKALVDVATSGRNASDTAFKGLSPEMVATVQNGLNMLYGVVKPDVKP